MSVEQNKALARQFYGQVINGRDLKLARSLLRPDFVDHNAPPGTAPGIEGFFAFAAMVTTAFPDLHVEVEDVFAEGDRVAVRVAVGGTHLGTLMGRAEPTGRKATWTGIDIMRMEGGQIAERWSERDILGLMGQLEGGD